MSNNQYKSIYRRLDERARRDDHTIRLNDAVRRGETAKRNGYAHHRRSEGQRCSAMAYKLLVKPTRLTVSLNHSVQKKY